MLADDLLGNGESQARTAGLPGARLIHPVKPLENSLSIPVGDASSQTRSRSAPADMTIRPPSGVYLMALERIFIITCKILSRSPRTLGSPSVPSSRSWWPWRWASIRTA